MNPYRLNDCKLTLNESLEQIHHIDKLEEKVNIKNIIGEFSNKKMEYFTCKRRTNYIICIVQTKDI